MATFLCVPGAWHGAWVWDKVRPRLEAEGHKVLTPDLTGMGADKTPLAQTRFEDWSRGIADLAVRQKTPVILVGHSRGGIVISQAAEIAPGAIASTVYLAAMLVPDGKRMGDVIQPGQTDPAIAAAITLNPDGASTTLRGDVAAAAMYNTTPPEDTTKALSLLCAEPLFAGATKMKLSAGRFGQVPRAYIECLQDRSVPIALQRAMQKELPCWCVETLDTDHSPFFSAPMELSAALNSIAAAAPNR